MSNMSNLAVGRYNDAHRVHDTYPYHEIRNKYPRDASLGEVDFIDLSGDSLVHAYKLYPQFIPACHKGTVVLYGDIARTVLSAMLYDVV